MINSENYAFQFGKFKSLLASEVAEIKELKDGKLKNTGLNYLKWLCDKCEWFKHKDIIREIIVKKEQEIAIHNEVQRNNVKTYNKTVIDVEKKLDAVNA